MATLSQLQTSRAAAGSAYASALASLKSAYISLAALDRTIGNTNVSGATVQGFPLDHAALNNTIRMLSHSQFAPNQAQGWEDQILAASNAQISAFTPG
ncbi:hypothetical protein [Bradyrhizobium stylosanthis]|uniref:Uncharacterized protein n=1 Tax=Bradyrhizobium stylosanthis TaxID=1803665 RepID=A0A560D1V4_9BRAD|nr:hypothetical protein [Bradyrhizobium stylosanthis]TWA91096.1 hypothetical protein FBZ96_11494 [Bradyrhizobium stylosanthis]